MTFLDTWIQQCLFLKESILEESLLVGCWGVGVGRGGGQVGLLGLMGLLGLSGLSTQTRTFYPQKCMNF